MPPDRYNREGSRLRAVSAELEPIFDDVLSRSARADATREVACVTPAPARPARAIRLRGAAPLLLASSWIVAALLGAMVMNYQSEWTGLNTSSHHRRAIALRGSDGTERDVQPSIAASEIVDRIIGGSGAAGASMFNLATDRLIRPEPISAETIASADAGSEPSPKARPRRRAPARQLDWSQYERATRPAFDSARPLDPGLVGLL